MRMEFGTSEGGLLLTANLKYAKTSRAIRGACGDRTEDVR